MSYLIDTDWLVDWLGKDSAAQALFDSIEASGLGISVITYMECTEGILRAPEAEREALVDVLRHMRVIEVTRDIAERCAALRHTLRVAGRSIRGRGLDLIIAATAMEHNLALVTRNIDDYRDIPGLRLHRS